MCVEGFDRLIRVVLVFGLMKTDVYFKISPFKRAQHAIHDIQRFYNVVALAPLDGMLK